MNFIKFPFIICQNFILKYLVRQKLAQIDTLQSKIDDMKLRESEMRLKEFEMKKRVENMKIACQSQKERRDYLIEELDSKILLMAPLILEIQYRGGPETDEQIEAISVYSKLIEAKQLIKD